MFCKKCGNELPEGAIFCGNCGYKTKDSEGSNISRENKTETKGKKKIWIIIGLILLVLIILVISFIFRNRLFRTGNKEENITTQDNPIAHTYTEEEIQNMIGKYVDYKPQNNTYIAKTSMTGIAGEGAVEAIDQIFSTEIDMKWRIWDVNNANIMLISDKATMTGGYGSKYNLDGMLVLEGKTGYDNGNTILNELCKTCYNNEQYNGIKVRSLSLTDIKEILKRETWENGVQVAINEIGGENKSTNGWSTHNGLKNSDFNNPNYLELINDEGEAYYLNYKVNVSVDDTEAFGYQEVSKNTIWCGYLYMDYKYLQNSNIQYARIRPVVIIPSESYELDTKTEGTETDMWKIEAK